MMPIRATLVMAAVLGNRGDVSEDDKRDRDDTDVHRLELRPMAGSSLPLAGKCRLGAREATDLEAAHREAAVKRSLAIFAAVDTCDACIRAGGAWCLVSNKCVPDIPGFCGESYSSMTWCRSC